MFSEFLSFSRFGIYVIYFYYYVHIKKVKYFFPLYGIVCDVLYIKMGVSLKINCGANIVVYAFNNTTIWWPSG